jgi:myo-inositol-1(or 4)-monophosphatase
VLAVTYHIGMDCTFYALPVASEAFQRLSTSHERQLQTSSTATLRKALLITGFPYHRSESADNNSAEFAYFMPRTASVRNLGSAALDLAHVALGAADAYWKAWLNPWDLTADVLLVREAGGWATTYTGQEWTIGDRQVIASNGSPELHAALLTGIQNARATNG